MAAFENQYILAQTSRRSAFQAIQNSRAEMPLVPSRISDTGAFRLSPKSLKIKGKAASRPDQIPPTRTEIFQFSENSRRRLRFAALNAWPKLISQFCLTYHEHFPSDGKELKRQLHNFLKVFRKRYPGTVYLWILEFQRRGAPHFHLFLPFSPSPEVGRELAAIWLRVSGQSDDQQAVAFHEHSRNFITWDMGNGSYICKYIEKSRQKDVPDNFVNVGRFWGASRGLVPMPIDVDFDSFASAHDLRDEKTGECSDAVILAARWLGKWYERQTPKKYRKFRRNFRKMAMKTGWTLATGAAAFKQIEKFLYKTSEIFKGAEDDRIAKMASYQRRKVRRNAYFSEASPFDSGGSLAPLGPVPPPTYSDYQRFVGRCS